MFPLFPLLLSKKKKGTTKSEGGSKRESSIRMDRGIGVIGGNRFLFVWLSY
jgi:hypothetical protein